LLYASDNANLLYDAVYAFDPKQKAVQYTVRNRAGQAQFAVMFVIQGILK
jgi:hypothetical protein